MQGTESRHRVILDPSFLFTEEALGWMEDVELAGYLAVSESLLRRLEAFTTPEEFAPYREERYRPVLVSRSTGGWRNP
jgi:hypothetical protein